MALRGKFRDHVRLDNSRAKLKNHKMENELRERLGGIEAKEKSIRLSTDVKLVDAKNRVDKMRGLQNAVVQNDDFLTATNKLQLSRYKSIQTFEDAVEGIPPEYAGTAGGNGGRKWSNHRRSECRAGIIKPHDDKVDWSVVCDVVQSVNKSANNLFDIEHNDGILRNGVHKQDKFNQNLPVNHARPADTIVSEYKPTNQSSVDGIKRLMPNTVEALTLKTKTKTLFNLSEEDNDLLKSLIGYGEKYKQKIQVHVPTATKETSNASDSDDESDSGLNAKNGMHRRIIKKPGVSVHNRMLKLGQGRPRTAPVSTRIFEETLWSNAAKKRIRERKKKELDIARDLVMRKSAPARLLVYFDATTMNRMFDLQEVDGNRVNYMRHHLVYDPDEAQNADSLEYMFLKSGNSISKLTRRSQSAPVRRNTRPTRKSLGDPSRLYVGLSRHKLKELNDSRERKSEFVREVDDAKMRLKTDEKLEFIDLQDRVKSFIVELDSFIKR